MLVVSRVRAAGTSDFFALDRQLVSLLTVLDNGNFGISTFVLTGQINPTIFQTELIVLLDFCICFY